MKYEVTRRFTDKYTKEKYEVGTILELTEDRAKEIFKKGKEIKETLIKKVKEENPKE